MEYECENYKSVYDPLNKTKLDVLIVKELAEGYFNVVNNRPTYVHKMGAVHEPDRGIRPITNCRMDISVNDFCW